MTTQIMIVDDNPSILNLYGKMLEGWGYSVLQALDGASALAMLQESTPDLFILDVMMPEMNGIELCQRIRALPQYEQTPVLILSAFSETKTVEQTFSAGANDYLVKPVEPNALNAKIRDLLS